MMPCGFLEFLEGIDSLLRDLARYGIHSQADLDLRIKQIEAEAKEKGLVK